MQWWVVSVNVYRGILFLIPTLILIHWPLFAIIRFFVPLQLAPKKGSFHRYRPSTKDVLTSPSKLREGEAPAESMSKVMVPVPVPVPTPVPVPVPTPVPVPSAEWSLGFETFVC